MMMLQFVDPSNHTLRFSPCNSPPPSPLSARMPYNSHARL